MRIGLLLISLSLTYPYVVRAEEPPAAADTPAPAAAAVEKTPAQLKKEAAEAKIRQFGVNGYKPETTKSGDTVYCKKEAPIGSRFETKQCRTYEQLRDETLNAKEYVEQLQRVGTPTKN
jgi:hypothetical protein